MVGRSLVPWIALGALALSGGCGGDSPGNAHTPLPPGNTNLIFVVSEDLEYHAPGDVSPVTANLTGQGLHRSLLLATFLRDQVLGAENVTAIHALIPMTHLQTAGQVPDLAALETVQQFAMLNTMPLAGAPGGETYTGHNFPIDASYAPGTLPSGVATPAFDCDDCLGLEFDDRHGRNAARAVELITARQPGFHVFAAPWSTTRRLLRAIDAALGFTLQVPSKYAGPNVVYAITVAPAGAVRLVRYDGGMEPAPAYPALPAPVPRLAACEAAPFRVTAVGGVDGVVVPADVNRNQTLYFVRHAEAHPTTYYGDGNYVAAGQWRALALASALQGKIQPNQVYSTDPAQLLAGSYGDSGRHVWSNPAPALSVLPYAIANDLPYGLAAQFLIGDENAPDEARDFFFRGGRFSGTATLVGWHFQQIPLTVNALLASYHYTGPAAPDWSAIDYDSIWMVTIDADGNLSVDNSLCEGIDSARLPETAPPY